VVAQAAHNPPLAVAAVKAARELLNQPVKFSVERPVSQDVMDPDGPTATGPAFPSQICKCNTKKAAQSAIHGERRNRCIDGL